MKIQIATVLSVVALAGCASTKTAEPTASVPLGPVPVTAPASVVLTPPAPPSHPYAMPAQPVRVVAAAPAWFVKLPESTADMLFTAGTAVSSDEQMAYDKARLSAERTLAEKLSGAIRSQTRSYRNDTTAGMQERFESVVRRTANGELIGAEQVDSQVTHDGRNYKVYVLIRYPLADNNQLRQEVVNARSVRNVDARAQQAEQDMDRNVTAQRLEQQQDEQVAVPPVAQPAAPVELVGPVSAQAAPAVQ